MHGNWTTAAVAWAFLAPVLAPLAEAEVAPPVFADVVVRVSVSWTGTAFRYEYAAANPASNTLDLKGLRLELGSGGEFAPVTPFGTPQGFYGVGEHTGFAYWGPGPAHRTAPGMAFEGVGLESRVPPEIHRMIVEPYLLDYLRALREDREAHGEELSAEEQYQLQGQNMLGVQTLGPLGPSPGTFGHWNTWQADIAQAKQLGWISNATLATTIETNVTAARQAILASDSATARTKLQAVIDAIQASQTSQRTSEGYALVFFNAQYLRDHLPTPCAPKLSLAPDSATQPVGTSYTATATLVNVADGKPFPGFYVNISVTSGPHVGMKTFHGVDENGNITLVYTGTKLGEDVIQAWTLTGPGGLAFDFESSPIPMCIPFGLSSPLVKVKWEGGPDLAVTSFVPPVLKTTGGQASFITEETENLGNTAALPSVTRYYLSSTKSIDPATARVVGERPVAELAPEASSSVDELAFTVPSDLPEGLYYLGACADADGTVIETNEDNNCSFSEMAVQRGIIVAVERTNQPPDCSQAHADPNALWPPNHKLVPIQILGVTDPEGDPVSITVTGITQDEPTNGLGDGDTSPDGFGVGTSRPQIRAERAGNGNGRVYVISFRAEDGQGGSCTGSVKVTVPHDKKSEAVDDGQSYDSTK